MEQRRGGGRIFRRARGFWLHRGGRGLGGILPRLGCFRGLGGRLFFSHFFGPAKAAEMFYTGDMIDAKTALQLGLVNRLVPADQLEGDAKAFAGTSPTDRARRVAR